MSIVKKGAEEYKYQYLEHEVNIRGDYEKNTVQIFNSKLERNVEAYYKDSEKILFLNTLKMGVHKIKTEHLDKCNNKTDCNITNEHDMGLYSIQQFLDKLVSKNVSLADGITTEHRISINNKLDVIIEKLRQQGFANEIIFNEINEMREMYDLGKKNWSQLLKGKIISLTNEKLIDEAVIDPLVDTLKDAADNIIELI